MRHRRDQLGKDLLDLLLSRWGTLRTEDPVPAADLQRADVSFVPTAPLPEFSCSTPDDTVVSPV